MRSHSVFDDTSHEILLFSSLLATNSNKSTVIISVFAFLAVRIEIGPVHMELTHEHIETGRVHMNT